MFVMFVSFMRHCFLGCGKGLLENGDFVSVRGVRILAILCGSAIMGERLGGGLVGL